MTFNTLALMIILLTGNSIHLIQPPPQDKERDKALLQAVEKGDRQAALDLLKQGANVNAKGINDSALETAIIRQDVEMVRLLLGKGAEIKPGDLADAARGPQGDNEKAAIVVGLLFDRKIDLAACAEKTRLTA